MRKLRVSIWLMGFLLVLSILHHVSPSYAYTSSGSLTQDEVWSGEIDVTGDVTVPSGVILTIEPGTVVRFAASTGLAIYGTINASGTYDSPVAFRSSSSKPSSGIWNGIYFYPSSSNSCSLDHVSILYGYYGIYCDSASPTITNSVILKSSIAGIVLYGASSQVSGCVIQGNGGIGIDVYNCSPSIIECTVSNNGGNAVSLQNSSSIISRCIIDNHQIGIYVDEGSPEISDNNIQNCSTCININKSLGEPFIHNNIFAYSGFYWSYEGYGIIVSFASPKITYNSFCSNYNWIGIYLNEGSGGTISSNIILRCRTGIYSYSGEGILSYNDLYDNDTDYDGISAGPTDLTTVPYFADGNFRLQEGSPLLTAGQNGEEIGAYGQGGAPPDHIDMPLSGPFKSGSLSQDEVWSGEIDVIGSVTVPEGRILTIQPGTVIRFGDKAGLHIYGGLYANGTADSIITFTSSSSNPQKGHWEGIYFYATSISSSSVEYALLEYGTYGVICSNASPAIKNSVISNSQYSGIALGNSSSLVSGCIIKNSGYSGISISGMNCSAEIINNNIYQCESAIDIYTYGGNVKIYNNIIRSYGDYGIYSEMNSSSDINYNTFQFNKTAIYLVEYFTGNTGNINVSSNIISSSNFGIYIDNDFVNCALSNNDFWDNQTNYYGISAGTTDLYSNPLFVDEISGDVRLQDGSPLLTAGQGGEQIGAFGANGNPPVCPAPYTTVPTTSGSLTENEMWSGNIQITGSVNVPFGYVLSIQPGTVIKFANGTSLNVYGRLNANGTSAAPITFTSSSASPWKGIWDGINFCSTSLNSSTLDHTRIEYAYTGVDCNSCNPGISNSVISNNSMSGINLTSASPRINGCSIQPNNNCHGIYISGNSSPEILNNDIFQSRSGVYIASSTAGYPFIHNNIIRSYGDYGIFVGGSLPTISFNTLPANGTGIYLNGGGSTLSSNIITSGYTGIYRNSGSYSLSYNDLWNNQTNYSGLPAGANDIFSDPLFVSASDFHLQAGSKCIDAGEPGFTDEDGSRADIGAFGGRGGSKPTDAAPTKPSNVQPANGDTSAALTSVTLNANEFSDANTGDFHAASEWQIRRADGTYAAPVYDSGVTTTALRSVTIPWSEFNQNTTYYWHVRYMDNRNGWSEYSDETSFTFLADSTPPEDVTSLQVQCFSDRLFFTWTPSANSAKDLYEYTIEVSSGSYSDIYWASADSNSSWVTDLEPATSYTITISSYDYLYNRSAGVSINAVTLLGNPSDVAVQPYSGRADLSWSDVQPRELVDHYCIYVSQSNFTSVQGMTPRSTVAGNSASVTGLDNGVKWYIAVTSVNLSGGEEKNVQTVVLTPQTDKSGPAISNVKVDGNPLADGYILHDSATFTLSAVDPSGVSRVEFKLDGGTFRTDTNGSTSYSGFLNISKITDGSHTLNITAYDTVGNKTILNYILSVVLDPPQAPTITQPSSGSSVNKPGIIVSGKAQPNSQVILFRNNAQSGGQTTAGTDGNFSLSLTLAEGENAIQAVATNRAGSSPKSGIVVVTLDTTKPQAPTGLTAQANAGGLIRLGWTASKGTGGIAYNVYRSAMPFNAASQAVKINNSPVTVISFDNIPSLDRLYYYRVSSLDQAGNESDLSDIVSATSDSLAPRAVSIQYMPTGPFSPSTGRTGQGVVNLRLTVSEPLGAIPFLSITPNGGVPVSIDLIKTGDLEYAGSFVITDSTPSGTAYAVFSARDVVGNRGTEIDAGTSIIIDSTGPAVSQITLQNQEMATIRPGQPIKNDQKDSTGKPQPTSLVVTFGLNEAMNPGATPHFSYLLSGQGRSAVALAISEVTPPLNGQAQTWRGSFHLPADAGLSSVESLQFAYRGVDDLNNVGVRILCDNLFQVYQGNLPPLDAPQGLTGKALPGGKVKLTWQPVANAAGYQVFQGLTSTSLSPYGDPVTDIQYIDKPASDGAYYYAVASIRRENGQTAVSAPCAPVRVTADSIIPNAPSNLSLTLTGQGIAAQWTASAPIPGVAKNIAYSLYRSDLPGDFAVEGLMPVVSGVKGTTALDSHPSATEHRYEVTAVDEAGNESLPSNSFYLNAGLLPVSTLKVAQNENSSPILSWTAPNVSVAGSIVGYNVTLNVSGRTVKLNQSPIAGLSAIDTGYAGDERYYTVTAVDENGVESIGRSIALPLITATIKDGQVLKRGLMNRLNYTVVNGSAEKIEHIRLKVVTGTHQQSSEEFSIDPGATLVVPVAVGGYSDLPDAAAITTTIQITPSDGESVSITRSSNINVVDGSLLLQITNQEFVRGARGIVQFSLTNTGDEEIEIVTARSWGSSVSDEITCGLIDSDGNTLSSVPFKQALGENVVTLSDGATVARIASGSTFTSNSVDLPVPGSAPDQLKIQIAITKIHYREGTPEQVTMQGLSNRQAVTISNTSYYGSINSISPQVSNGDKGIVITGSAIDRQNNQLLPQVPLNLVITLNGFEKTNKIYTDTNGAFSFTYTPPALESGIYSVRAIHPDLTDRPIQGQFTVNRLTIAPQSTNLTISRNYEQSLEIQVTAGDETTAHNIWLAYDPLDQPGGSYPEGVHVTVAATQTSPISLLSSKQSVSLGFKVWADNNAAQTDSIVLKVKSDESGSGAWGSVTLNMQYSDAKPVLSSTPDHVESGVILDGTDSEGLTLSNKGALDLTDLVVALLTEDGSQPAPAWLMLNSTSSLGNLAVGTAKTVNVSIRPQSATVVAGSYKFLLRATGSNCDKLDVPVYVTVTDSGIGNAIFKVSDIYTGTLDKNGQTVQGLAGARVEIQNELDTTIDKVLSTDSAGEVLFQNLSAGRYKYRVSAANHQEQIGRVWIKPAITASTDVFLDYNLVTIEWDVKETTIQDTYNIVLKATYETNVPAPVVVAEPASVTLSNSMQPGDVLRGEVSFTNYGLVRADNVSYSLPVDDQFFKFEMLGTVPTSIDAKSRFTLQYRVTCLRSPGAESGAGSSDCPQYYCSKLYYEDYCANGVRRAGWRDFCFITSYNGQCKDPYPYIPSVIGPNIHKPEPIVGVDCPQPPPPRTEPSDGDEKKDQKECVHSSVDMVQQEYNDSATDLMVKAPGGSIGILRTYYANTWHFEPFINLILTYSPISAMTVDSITMRKVVYSAYGSSGQVFVNGTSSITLTGNQYVWKDKGGNWISFDLNGQMKAYGSRSGAIGNMIYDDPENVNPTGIADRNQVQVMWLSWENGNLAAVSDSSGRRVEYTYTGNLLTRVKDVLGNTTSYEYDAAGKLSRKTDAAGHAETIGYDSHGRVTSILDSFGIGHTFEYSFDSGKEEYHVTTTSPGGMVKDIWYDNNGDTKRVAINGNTVKRIQKDGHNLIITDERGYITREDRDEWKNITKITYPDGSSVSYEYEHAYNKPVKSTNENGVITLYSYDSTGNLIRKTEAAGSQEQRVVEYTYDTDGNILTTEYSGDSNTQEAVTIMTYDTLGNMVSSVDPEGNMTAFTYDFMGNLLTKTDARGRVWTYGYNAAGKLVSTTDPLRNSANGIYDPVGNLLRMIDAEGRETTATYDEHNRPTSTSDTGGNITAYEYNGDGKITKTIDPEGKIVQYVYDSQGRPIEVIDGTGKQLTIEYGLFNACTSCPSKANQPSRIIYPTFTKEFKYDALLRKIEEKDILSQSEIHTKYFEYDTVSNLVTYTDKNANNTHYIYDALGRKVKEIDVYGNYTSYKYDSRDNLIKLIDANGNSTHLEYNRNNQLVKEIRPMGQVTTYRYDTVGNLIQKTDPKGQVTQNNYDDAGRLVEIKYFSGSDLSAPERTVTLSYDKLGHILRYDDGESSADYIYDGAYRKAKEVVNYGPFQLENSIGWYGNGKEKSFTGPDEITYTYNYDNANQLSTIEIPGQGFITLSSYIWRIPKSILFPGGTSKQLSYDSIMRIQSIAVKDPGSNIILSHEYTYDKIGNIVTNTTEHGLYAYTYDNLDRLTTVANSSQLSETYTYDAVGNRLTSEGIIDVWMYDINNQLRSFGNTFLEYDMNGNTVEQRAGTEKLKYIYDVNNRLLSVETETGSVIARYGYDPFGRRIWKDVGGVKTYFHYSSYGLIGEYDQTGAEIKVYGYRPGSTWTSDPLFMKKGADYYWYQNDHLMTPMILTSSYGSIVWTAKYSEFGNSYTDTINGLVNNLKLPGQYYDEETSMNYNWHRYYVPKIGRYMTQDPIGIKGGINLYLYSNGNPINLFDSYGLCGRDMHYSITRDIARRVGYSNSDSEIIGLSDQLVDYYYNPLPSMSSLSIDNRRDWHFVPVNELKARISNLFEAAVKSCNLGSIGETLHVVQDAYCHSGYSYGIGHSLAILSDPDDIYSDPAKSWKMFDSTEFFLNQFKRNCKDKCK